MKTLTVQVDESGIVRVPPEARLSGLSQLTLVVAEPGDNGWSGETLAQIAQVGGAFDFLAAEPDLYSDADIEPGNENPDFGGHATSR
jgi:hypothetical protein